MERTPVESSNLASVGYEAGMLEVQFRDGAVYQYHNVPPEVHTALLAAPSKGAFLSLYVANKFDLTANGKQQAAHPQVQDDPLTVFPPDRCCAKHFRRAKLSPDVSIWECPRCGAAWQSVQLGAIRNWEPVIAIQIW